MINDGINNVPDKTIAIFIHPNIEDENLTKDRISSMIKKSTKKRDWFTPHFYRCLPLTIGNRYGFTIALEFDVSLEWNGGNNTNDLKIFTSIDKNKVLYPLISSHFGSGIATINPPIFLRTPPGVNIMTINPPNFVLPNITVMTGVVETDNLRRNFTFNLKMQMPGLKVEIPAGTPLAGFIPIPRYYADNFELKFADDIFSKDLIQEEIKASTDAGVYRDTIEPTLKNNVGKHYFKGTDIYGNKFPDHQNP